MSKARNISNIFSGTTDAATDAEVTAAIASHNTSANGHVKRGGTAGRPGSPSIGDIYYNTDIKDLEQYTEDGWLIVAKQPPRIPTIGTATLQGDNSVSISFTPSSYGQTASSYTAQSDPGSYTATGSSSPITFPSTNLALGTSYAFRVKATGTYGDSSYTGYTGSVTIPQLTSYESISTATVTTATNNITFSSIPSGYTHLQVRAYIVPAGEDNLVFEFNDDSGSNYSAHQIQGDGSSAAAYAVTSTTMYIMGLMQNNSNAPFSGVYDILDYTNTNKYTTVRGLVGQDGNTASTGYRVGMHSGSWRNTAAVTKLKIYTVYGNFIGVGSKVALYGIKGE